MQLFKFEHRKADGRKWIQYDLEPFPPEFQITDEGVQRPDDWVSPTVRFNAMRNEWVAYAPSRQNRPFLPPKDYCPLCPTHGEAFDTEGRLIRSEVPQTSPSRIYQWAAFENLFPGLAYPEHQIGHCEVILYGCQHEGSLSTLPLVQLQGLMRVWQDRSRSVRQLPGIEQVFIFENRGVEVGVTLHHPHGQMYAFHHVPPIIAREHAAARSFYAEHATCLVCHQFHREIAGPRLLLKAEGVASYVPEAARLPYEVHITTQEHRTHFEDLTDVELDAVASQLQKVLRAYDGLFDKPMPYMLCHHQCSSSETDCNSYHWHLELYPMLRQAEKLKYLAGVETGAGLYINDTIPEEKAEALRQALRKEIDP